LDKQRTREINPEILISEDSGVFRVLEMIAYDLSSALQNREGFTKDVFLFSPKIDMMYKKSNVLTKYYWLLIKYESPNLQWQNLNHRNHTHTNV